MAEDIPFDRKFDAVPGRADRVAPGVRRVLAPNPGPFTFTGTCSYIVGEGEVAIIDPGPDDPVHVAALMEAVRGERVTHILLTHTHRDHSGALEALKALTGAPTHAQGPHRAARPSHEGEGNALESAADRAFFPDVALADGAQVHGAGWRLHALATPGHAANHMAFVLEAEGLVFVGDHVMGWSTTIVAPPDGSMNDYMDSLRRLHARPETLYLPGHGGPVREGRLLVERLIRHRKARETAILRALERGPMTIPQIVRAIYFGLDPRLAGAAGLSTLAHLEDLVARGAVLTDGPAVVDGVFTRP
ncbi:MBL fold metallo-hydrolase [Ancylobacter amanitiformis]|uniref:Glyoxylase-like metal-dependent hydrolase (Beta-lactamase superfamily II) n=1 Tax=Ancylobacter amanitiformis TaxID=217069 RepID=A0ABU0LUM2_9HYPH|nr:MBL fold metallo-hydrolase [Ancylobacter amanitiformis]MDQ0512419.1 glyoxylase-like metal-dependent hydrolase (beta-lactamase superfamily II) [Ancylobacter amanitiformis]